MKTGYNMDAIQKVKQLRASFNAVKAALPWLDCAVWKDEKPEFEKYAVPTQTDFVKRVEAKPGIDPAALRAEGACIVCYNSEVCTLPALDEVFLKMAMEKIPLSVLHTQVDFEQIEELAAAYRELNIIIESGDRKLIYHHDEIFHALKKCDNIYLCNYNFCNWLGHERIVAENLGNRLLYGSHSPLFSAGIWMAPIIMGNFSWTQKCAFAGNNLRVILGMAPVVPPEAAFKCPEPFIIDAHTHNQQPGDSVNGFFTPDMNYTSAQWVDFMDSFACEMLLLVPSEALFYNHDAQELSAALRRYAPERFRFMALFNPTQANDEYMEILKKHLRDPDCIGIKIHPSAHNVEGDKDCYEQIYALAEKCGKPIMSHTWDVSDYNPVQYMSHPDRFRPHLEKYHKVPFVMGHAGGRPGAFEATIKLCEDFPNVYVDFAGDYYYNGVIEAFVDRIGADRVLFASDIDWFDPRCNVGLFLCADVSDGDLLKMLRSNARHVYFENEKSSR